MSLVPGLTSIQGQPCFLIEDTLSDSFPDQPDTVPISYTNRQAVFCSRKHLHNIREKYPNVPVYGIWQLIFANQKQWPQGLFVLYFDLRQREGMLLLHEGADFNSCRIKAGKAVFPLPIDLSAAEPIQLDVATLKLPPHIVLTAEERETAMRVRMHRWFGLTGTLAMSAVMVFVLGNWWWDYLQHTHWEMEQQRLEETTQLEEEYAFLQQSRLAHWPQQWQVLLPFARLLSQAIPFEVWSIQFEQAVVRIQLFPMTQETPGYFPRWLVDLPDAQFLYNKNATLEVSWSNHSEEVE